MFDPIIGMTAFDQDTEHPFSKHDWKHYSKSGRDRVRCNFMDITPAVSRWQWTRHGRHHQAHLSGTRKLTPTTSYTFDTTGAIGFKQKLIFPICTWKQTLKCEDKIRNYYMYLCWAISIMLFSKASQKLFRFLGLFPKFFTYALIERCMKCTKPVSTSHSAQVMSPLLVTICWSSRNRQQER